MELLKGSEHPIYEIELAVVLVAIEMGCSFERHLRGCNEEAQAALAALAALVSGRSAAANRRRVLQRILDVEKRTPWRLGVGLPSHSNPADRPSRGECSALCFWQELRAQR